MNPQPTGVIFVVMLFHPCSLLAMHHHPDSSSTHYLLAASFTFIGYKKTIIPSFILRVELKRWVSAKVVL